MTNPTEKCTAVETKATIAFGTSQIRVPSAVRWDGKRLWCRVKNDTVPEKNRSRMTEMMIGLWYGRLRSAVPDRISLYKVLVFTKLNLLRTYIRASWENVIIIVVDLPVDQIGDQRWRAVSVDQKCDRRDAALLDLCTKNADACSELNSFINIFQGNVLCNIPVRPTWQDTRGHWLSDGGLEQHSGHGRLQRKVLS